MKILIASDGFLTDDVLTTAIQNELPDAELSRIASTWPTPAFGDVGDVQEALGDEDALIEALQGNEVVISHTFPFTEKVIAASPDLKLITICRGGPVNVNIDAATKHGVMVSYAPGRNARATAEHSVAMLLAAARQIAQRHMEVVNGEWATDYYLFENRPGSRSLHRRRHRLRELSEPALRQSCPHSAHASSSLIRSRSPVATAVSSSLDSTSCSQSPTS